MTKEFESSTEHLWNLRKLCHKAEQSQPASLIISDFFFNWNDLNEQVPGELGECGWEATKNIFTAETDSFVFIYLFIYFSLVGTKERKHILQSNLLNQRKCHENISELDCVGDKHD